MKEVPLLSEAPSGRDCPNECGFNAIVGRYHAEFMYWSCFVCGETLGKTVRGYHTIHIMEGRREFGNPGSGSGPRSREDRVGMEDERERSRLAHPSEGDRASTGPRELASTGDS